MSWSGEIVPVSLKNIPGESGTVKTVRPLRPILISGIQVGTCFPDDGIRRSLPMPPGLGFPESVVFSFPSRDSCTDAEEEVSTEALRTR